MSRETTEARFAHQQAEQELTRHRAACATCTVARRSRQQPPCDDGWQLILALRAAVRTLADNRALDRQPIPGQKTLF